jgi:hypothetical protein
MRPFNKSDCLIEVITLAGLAVLHMFKVSIYGLKLKNCMGKKNAKMISYISHFSNNFK